MSPPLLLINEYLGAIPANPLPPKADKGWILVWLILLSGWGGVKGRQS